MTRNRNRQQFILLYISLVVVATAIVATNKRGYNGAAANNMFASAAAGNAAARAGRRIARRDGRARPSDQPRLQPAPGTPRRAPFQNPRCPGPVHLARRSDEGSRYYSGLSASLDP